MIYLAMDDGRYYEYPNSKDMSVTDVLGQISPNQIITISENLAVYTNAITSVFKR
jgi:hypothetical protein